MYRLACPISGSFLPPAIEILRAQFSFPACMPKLGKLNLALAVTQSQLVYQVVSVVHCPLLCNSGQILPKPQKGSRGDRDHKRQGPGSTWTEISQVSVYIQTVNLSGCAGSLQQESERNSRFCTDLLSRRAPCGMQLFVRAGGI